MSSITDIALARMTNEVHVQFHESVMTLIEQTLVVKEMTALHSLYTTAFENEKAALLIIKKSEFTEQIAEQDRVRDAIFRGFSDTVKGFRNHFDIAVREAANLLWNVFLHYGNLAKKTLDAQTAATEDILREFEREELKQAIVKLKVADWRDKLNEENQKLHKLMMDRYTEIAGQTTLRMKTTRVETDKYYRAIVAALNNLTLTVSTCAVDDFVASLNAIIKRYKDILAQQLGRKHKES